MVNKFTNVIVAWHDRGSCSFEEQIPLLYVGRRNLSIGSSNPITILFLYGLSNLDPDYVAELKKVGYTIINAEKQYQSVKYLHPSLDRFGSYEKNCFLRWLILAKIFRNQPLIHYDGDIVWNIAPEEIARLMKNKTFLLDKGPAFAVFSNPQWLKIYVRELKKFASNPVKYGTDWEGTPYRRHIGSDQDLIDYLLQKGLLPQDNPPYGSYRFVENPLCLIGSSFENLAFWHMQTDFIHYINLHHMLAPYGLSHLTPNPLHTKSIILKAIYLLGLLAGRKYMTRRQAYLYWFNK